LINGNRSRSVEGVRYRAPELASWGGKRAKINVNLEKKRNQGNGKLTPLVKINALLENR